MRALFIIAFFLFAQHINAQKMSLTYTNYGTPIVFGKDSIRTNKIHEIIVHPDSTFEFWSRPLPASCLTWHGYKGTWGIEKDTLVFLDRYEVMENDVQVSYQKNITSAFLISFKTDKNSVLTTRKIKLQFVYDFKENLENIDSVFDLSMHNTLTIPFKSIPNFNQLASLKVEYQLNAKDKRSGYLTTNHTVNVRHGDIPNIINVQFVEVPKKETIYRTFKGVFKENTIVIISSNKTRCSLPDYWQDIEFESSYKLTK
jgi:hypothetical protein